MQAMSLINNYLFTTNDSHKLLTGGSTRARLCLHLLHRGVSTMGARFFILSTAHTEEDIDQTVDSLGHSLDAMLAEGTLDIPNIGG